MNFVFVYGSLKKGFHNHGVMGDSSFIGTATTKDCYDMVSFGSFPGVIKEGSYHIKGEVYYVDDDTLKNIDTLEGNGSFYKRELISLEKIPEVWCYFLIDHIEHTNDLAGIAKSGNVKWWQKR